MPASFGSVYKRCGCRDQASSAPLGRRCPHLRQRGHGSWYLAVELSPSPSGQRQRFRQGGCRSHAAAHDALRQLTPPADTALSPGPLTTGAWLQRWLTDRQTLRPNTRRNYAAHLRLYLLPWLGRIPLCLLTPTHVQAMFAGIAAEHAAVHRQWSPATASRLRATLRAALNAAIRRRLITSNAARDVELPVARRPHALDLDTDPCRRLEKDRDRAGGGRLDH